MNTQQKEQFDKEGYILVEDALTNEETEYLKEVINKITEGDYSRTWNIADVIGKDKAILKLVDNHKVLPIIKSILGSNIWVNHSHMGVNPPGPVDSMGWHRDGCSVHTDLSEVPLLSVKAIYYLTDLTEPGRGQTHIIPKLSDAFPVCVKPGTALIYDNFRVMHSVQSSNNSDITRLAFFMSYSYRWMQPLDKMTVEHYREECNDIQKQLLGLDEEYVKILTAEGRSNKYYPTKLALHELST